MRPESPVGEYCPEEHGFWDYTALGTGGMEHYQMKDYLLLLTICSAPSHKS